MSDEVVIGKFGRPHGVQGEVRLFAFNRDSDLLAPGLQLFVRGDETPLLVSSVRTANKFLIVAFEEIDGREDAARLTNREAFVPRDTLPAPDDDEFYLVDVVGFEVWAPDARHEEPEQIGRVKGWLDVGATDIMAVTGPQISGRLLVPHLDHVVQEIDFDARRVVLFPMQEWAPVDDKEAP